MHRGTACVWAGDLSARQTRGTASNPGVGSRVSHWTSDDDAAVVTGAVVRCGSPRLDTASCVRPPPAKPSRRHDPSRPTSVLLPRPALHHGGRLAAHPEEPCALRRQGLLPRCPAIDKRRVLILVALHRCDFFHLHKQVVLYADSLAWQESIFAGKKRLVDADEDHADTLIALQHAPVYTLGRATNVKKDVLFDLDDPPCEVHRVKRGGKATYHGPGQVCLYQLKIF
ncbi:hypothetical protein PR202_ga11987 [Eleusine coracana subsp. coracana]|uniref:BPL/LPL catalytic domain-containing protein n=1 Tax=Eleusine coracana subsp. coracana TaxID=191504 RepID=A0AAV5CB06_ELECO|nr:hypothetical protein PR202_ga11987 [Eleusine coracana subsp. coracana]